MTTSSTGENALGDPQYYRCRGLRACRGVQLSADAIERFVVSRLEKPPGDLSVDGRAACLRIAAISPLLISANRKRALNSLFLEIRADVANGEIELVVDDEAAAQWGQDFATP